MFLHTRGVEECVVFLIVLHPFNVDGEAAVGKLFDDDRDVVTVAINIIGDFNSHRFDRLICPSLLGFVRVLDAHGVVQTDFVSELVQLTAKFVCSVDHCGYSKEMEVPSFPGTVRSIPAVDLVIRHAECGANTQHMTEVTFRVQHHACH
ncbi:hypothetical protein D3C71_1396130 [compost metagenome]